MKTIKILLPETRQEIENLARRFWSWHAKDHNAQFMPPINAFIKWLDVAFTDRLITIEIGNRGDQSVGINGEEWVFHIDECQREDVAEIATAFGNTFDNFAEFPSEYCYIDGERFLDNEVAA